jgi:hypothetical protein
MPPFRFYTEQHSLAAARRAIQADLGIASRLWKVWRVVSNKEWSGDNVDASEVLACKLLSVQLWRQFRLLCISCESAEAIVAESISRSIYDTTLAVAFIIADEVRLYARLRRDRQGKPRIGEDHCRIYDAARKDHRGRPASLLPSRLRATLVLAHLELQDRSYARKKKSQGVVPDCVKAIAAADRRTKKHLRQLGLSNWSEALPLRWKRVLLQAGSYSGLSTQAMAEMLGGNFLIWYHTIYHFHSRSVHGVSTIKLLGDSDGEPTIKWFSDPEDVQFTLQTGLSQILSILVDVTERFSIGGVYVRAIEQLDREYRELVNGQS